MTDNMIGTILGPKGSGKSQLTGEIVLEHPRVVVLDFVGEYGRDLGVDECWGFKDSLAALRWAARAKTFRLSLRDLTDRDREDLLEVLFELKDHLLVVEEASVLCSPSSMPESLKRIVAIGRHRKISQLYVAQRPSLINRLVTSQSDWIVAFRQNEDRDVEYLVSCYGERMAGVRELADYQIAFGGNAGKAPRAIVRRLREQAVGRKKVAAGAGEVHP